MGITAQYVIVSKQELEQLLDGGASSLADDLYDERYGFRAPFAPPEVDAFQAELAANPLLLLDQKKVTNYINQVFEKVRAQQSLTEQRMRSSDPEEKLNEIIKLYAWGERLWNRGDIPQDFGGLTEDELVSEAIKRGYHLRLDLDKRWDAMHQLLTGITLRERQRLTSLANAQAWIEKAKGNENLPDGCVRDIETARHAVYAMCKELRQREDELACASRQLDGSTEPEDDVEGNFDEQVHILSGIMQTVWYAPEALHRTLMQIATMQKQIEQQDIESFNAARKRDEAHLHQVMGLFGANKMNGPVYMSWEQFINGLVESARSARLIESLMTDITTNLRSSRLSDVDLDNASRIADESRRLEKLISVPGWLNHFPSSPLTPVSIIPEPDAELLSVSISGGPICPGRNTHEATYLSVEQTRAIADVLTPLTSQELARKHHLSEWEDANDFYQLKKFYLRAASLEAGVIVYFG